MACSSLETFSCFSCHAARTLHDGTKISFVNYVDPIMQVFLVDGSCIYSQVRCMCVNEILYLLLQESYCLAHISPMESWTIREIQHVEYLGQTVGQIQKRK